MIYLYDKALENKFKSIFDRVVYASVDKFYDRYLIGTDNKEPIKLPALSLWRTSHEFNPYNARTQLTVPNHRMIKDEAMLRQIYSMQIKLTYQLDIWAASDIDRDDMMKEILYFLVSYPDIWIEYEGQKFMFPVQVEAPDDITDIAQFDSSGDLYRITIPLEVPDARLLFYQDARMCKYIDLSYYVDGQKDSTSEIK